MSLEQGVRYNIAAAGSASLRRTNYAFEEGKGLVNLPAIQHKGISLKQIDYVLKAEDSVSMFVPDVLFSSGLAFDFETLKELVGSASFLKAGHDGVSFFGADQTTFSNIKYNETLSGIEGDTMYVLSSKCTVTYNGTEYKYGDFFSVASDENEPEITFTKTGAPFFVEVLKHGYNLEDGESYYVYGTQDAISSGRYATVNSSDFYPGDVFTSSGTNQMSASGNGICLIKIDSDSVGENLRQWFNKSYGSNTITAHETDEKTYLIYDNISCLYNSSLIKPNPLLNNVFKTTLDSIHDQPGKIEWLNTSSNRKKPIIREIIKSSAVKPGEEYYLFHDQFTGFGRSNTITYNNVQYNTVITGSGGEQPVFGGINSRNSYSAGYKSIDKTDGHKDPDWEGEVSNAKNIDILSGNPMVIKKEPVGLKAGQKYVFVAEPVTNIKEGKYYVLSKGRNLKYNNATISTGQVFKGVTDETGWETIPKNLPSIIYSDGTEEITLVTNEVTVNTLENNGEPITLETTIKNRKVEFTASDNTTSPYLVSGSSPILYWTKPSNVGKGYIYKSVETLEENKKYYIASEGDGFIQYPPEDLTYSCLRPDKVPSEVMGTKLTKTELDTQKDEYEATNIYDVCIAAGGSWVPETDTLSKSTKKLYNRDSFSAIHGKCEKDGERLWDREFKDSCKDLTAGGENKSFDEPSIALEWTPYTTFKEKKDTLLAYGVTESTHDQSLIHKVVFKDEEAQDVLPDDTKTPKDPRTYAVAPLKQKLSQYQVLRFPRQREVGGELVGSEPTFIVTKDYPVSAIEIQGWLLYDKIPVYTDDSTDLANRTATASLTVDKATNGASSTNPFNLYYAEPYELELGGNSNVPEGTQTITFTASLPFDLDVDEFLVFKDSNEKLSQFKITQKAASGSTTAVGIMICPETAEANLGAKAKVSGKKIATYCTNTKFRNNQRFTGIEGKPIVRFKDRRRITSTEERDEGAPNVFLGNAAGNIEASASANASIHKIEIKENTSATPSESVSYTVGGEGFVSKGEDVYHGEVSGRIMINHPLGGTSLDKYNKSKFPWYEDEFLRANRTGIIQTVSIFPAVTHVPLGTKLYFPNAVFELTQNLAEGSTSMVGRFFLQAPSMTRSPRRIYHQDECNFIFIEAETFTGGTQSVSTDSKSFVYKTSAETKYSDAKGSDSRELEASNEKFSVVTANQEYYIKVTPDEVDPGLNEIEENLEYVVKGTGETVELASSYDSTNLEAGTGTAEREQTLDIVYELKEDLPIGTVLTFYPADQVRLVSGSEASAAFDFDSYAAVHRDYDGRTAYDLEPSEIDGLIKESIPAKTGGVKFTLSEAAGIGATSIKGTAEGKGLDQEWGSGHIKGSKLVIGCVAEVRRAIVYNNKTFRTGETFTGAKNTDPDILFPNIYTQYSNDFLNSTKNEKVYAYNAFVDYFLEKDIFSGVEFNIDMDLVADPDELEYRDFTRGSISGSESKFHFNGAKWDIYEGDFDTYEWEHFEDRRKHFYYLPASPTLRLSNSSAKIYKVNYKYIDKDNSSTGLAENSYTFPSGVTYKVGGLGDGYIDTSTYSVGKTFTVSSAPASKIFYPSSPSVYDKTPTSLEPSKFYILEYPEIFSTETIQRLSTLKYNNKKYFSHNYDFIDMDESIKIKYPAFPDDPEEEFPVYDYTMRYPMLNSYLFGRPEQQFVENVRNFNENLGKPNFQKIHETHKRINGAQDYNGTKLWEKGLQSFNRYFDILDNSFETFNILRGEKYYEQWNKLKLAEQDIEGVRTFVNVIGGDRIDYEYPLCFGIKGAEGHTQNIMDFSSGDSGADIKSLPVIRLVDSEILPYNVSDIRYRVESSKESYFSSPTGSDIQAVRTLQPRPENRLKANSRYYLTAGSIKYLGYDIDGALKKNLDENDILVSHTQTITNGQVFTGKADYFDKDNSRVYFGNDSKYATSQNDIVSAENHEDKVMENRLGTFEFWNHVSGTPLVHPIIEQWEVEVNKTYYIAGDTDVDRVEYGGKVYKPGESFKIKDLDFNQPFSGDQDMFTDMLSTSDYKEAAARGLKPWMDDSYFRPRERGYIPLTPLVYRTISTGNIKHNVKYIAKGSGTITYDGETYSAQDKIAYPDNHFDSVEVGDPLEVLATFTTTSGLVKRKVGQNERIDTAVNYYVYGAGKVKYIEQVKYTGSEKAEGDYTSSGITFGAIGVDLPIYSVLSFSNGSTFILSESASSGATTLKGTLSGKLVTDSVAPVTKDKYNKQVEIANDYTNGSSVITIETVALPFNIPRGEVLYFYSEANAAKGKLTVSENATAGEKEIKGLLENDGLTAGDKANIVYAREHIYKEYTADGEFSASSSFVGLRGYDYFEITEGNPEVYVNVASGSIKKDERYYVFDGTVTYNSATYNPSNVFYGKKDKPSFTSSSASVVEVVEIENLEAGSYTAYGNNDNSNKLFTHTDDSETSPNDIVDLTHGSLFTWAADDTIEKYNSKTGVQSPAEPVVYSKTLDIVKGGQTYKLQSLSSSEPRGVVKYVEKSGTCKNPSGTSISSIQNAQDCLLEDTVRANLSNKTKPDKIHGGFSTTVDAITGVQGYTPGNYALGRDFEVFINDFAKYEPLEETLDEFTVDGQPYSTHKVVKYKIIEANSTVLFFNGGVIVPSEDLWVEGKYIKPGDEPFHPSRKSLFEYDLDTCEAYGGTWIEDESDENTYLTCKIENVNGVESNVTSQESDHSGGGKEYVRLNKDKWIAVTIKGEIQTPVSIKHYEEAPLFSWVEEAKTAYFTTDGGSYTSGSITTIKKSKNGEIKTGITYTLTGGTEISYNGTTVKRGGTFDGVADPSFASINDENNCIDLGGDWDSSCSKDLSEWRYTRNSDGTEYLTSEGSETEFTGIPNYEELEVVEGNPQIFTKSESFMVPEENVDETYVVEGSDDIKILSNDKISNLSNIKYSNSTSNETDLFAKSGTVESIAPRGVIDPTDTTSGYHSGKFVGVSGKTTYQLRSENWDSGVSVYHNDDGIRSAKLRTSSQWGVTINSISDETFMWNGDNEVSSFPNTGITEAEDYIDILVDEANNQSWAKPKPKSVLVFEGFRLAYCAKKVHSFPDITPYALESRSENQSYAESRNFSDVRSSRLLNLFAGRVIIGRDAVLFGKGEIALYDYDQALDAENDVSLKSTTFVKAYSNLEVSSGNIEGKAVTSLKKNYRYIVTAGTGNIKKSAIQIFNTNGYHNQKPDGSFCLFGYDSLDFFNNEVISGIRFKTIGTTDIYPDDGDDVTSAIFDSTISFGSESYVIGDYSDDSQQFITVSPLPVNLEAGETLKKGDVTLTLSERALKNSVIVKGSVTGGVLSGSLTRRIKLTITRVVGSKTSEERIDGSVRALDPTNSDSQLSCPASLTDGQISTSLAGVNGFSDEIENVTVGTRFTAIMDSSFPSGITGVSYSNVVPKAFFEDAVSPAVNYEYITHPRVEYLKGEPKFLFILGGLSATSGSTLDSTFYDYQDQENFQLASPPKDANDKAVFRHHLYDLNYGSSTKATVTINNSTKTAKNNFFIHNGTTNSFSLLSTKIKNNQDPPVALTSKVYIYKEVISGEIVSGKTYLIYGTGSVTYDGLKTTANNEFIPFLHDSGQEEILAFNCFKGGGVSDFQVEGYQETFWNKWDLTVSNGLNNIEDQGEKNSAIPVRHKVRRVSVPRVFELVYFSHYEDGATSGNPLTLPGTAADNKGTIYYVYGEGGITYGTDSDPLKRKTIYATNKYVAVGGQNYEDTANPDNSGWCSDPEYDNKVECEEGLRVWYPVNNTIKPSSFVYAGRIKQTAGFEYEYTKDGIINPVNKNNFFVENKYTMGNVEVNYSEAGAGAGVIDIDRENDIVVHRKVHALEGIENNQKYKVISSIRGEGKVGTTLGGENYPENAPLNSITYNSETVSPQGEQTTLASASGGRTENTGEVTISATSASDNVGTKTFSKSPKFIVSRRRLSKMKRKGLFRAIRAGKCSGCSVSTIQWYIGASTSMIRSKSDFYSDRYGSSHDFVTTGEAVVTDSTDPKPYQVGKPKGFTYVVRGGGSVKYPVTSSGGDYITSQDVNLTRIIPAGESFTPIEDHNNFIGIGLQYFLKSTGNETVYMIADPEEVPNYWKGLDRFAGMAPDRHGTPDGEIKAGISYRVLKYEAPKRLSKLGSDAPEQLEGLFNIRGEEGDKEVPNGDNDNVGYYRKLKDGSITEDSFMVGKTFVGLSGKKSLRDSNLGVFIREESGTYGNAPEEGWSNQWSMFMSQTVSSPSRTSLWHHDTYGDVLGFLNNRCHLHSLDFNSNKYSHLLQTFAYGIKPVIRSEAPPGYTYLEGSNAQQNWFAVQWLSPFVYDYASGKAKDVESNEFQDHLNMLYYRSCQIYRPDYLIDTIKCVDLGQTTSGGVKLASPDGNPMASGICSDSRAKDEDSCADIGGTWVPLKDRVEITLNRRLDHRINTRRVSKNLSTYSTGYLRSLHDQLAPGPWAPEAFRTDENAVIEYLIKQRKWKHKQLSTKDEPYYTSLQCHKARIGDAAPDINVWYDPDDPWGACDSRFYFTKQIPYAHDNNDEKEASTKTPIEIKTFQQMEFYLRAMCGGFIDQESNPKPLDYGNVELGLLPSAIPVCSMSKDYEYLFENLAYQSLNETKYGEENYKTVELWHDNSALLIKRERRAKIERRIKLNKLQGDSGYYHIYIGTGNAIVPQHIEKFIGVGSKWASPIATFVPTEDTEVFTDSYYVTLRDEFGKNKNHRIPSVQKYQIVTRDVLHVNVNTETYTVGPLDTAIIEDFQDTALIEWPIGDGLYYVLEKKVSEMPHYSEWDSAPSVKDIEASKSFNDSNNFTRNWDVSISPSAFEKIEFRVRVFFKESVFSGDRGNRIIEAVTDDPDISSPISVASITELDATESRMIDKDGSRFGEGSLATATETFLDGMRTYKIELIHQPSLWLGSERATTLNGQERLFYRIEYRTLSSYPDGEGQEGDWETVARFDNPAGSRISHLDETDYSFQNVSYRVSYVKSRSGGLRWISPLFRQDRFGKPNDPKGYGPLQNVKLRAAIFNQFANAINLLKEVRIDLPITVRTKDIWREWVTPHSKLISEPRTYYGNPSPPTWGIYARNEYAPGPHHTFTSMSELYHEALGSGSNYGSYFIGTSEGDEFVENGWFSTCAYKGFGFSKSPWIQGGSAWTALFFQDKQVKVSVPNDQTAMRWAIPPVFLDMFYGKFVTISGLNEHHKTATRFEEWPIGYHELKHNRGEAALAEEFVFCRNIDETGFSKYGEAVYTPTSLGEGSEYRRKESEAYSSWCGYVPGMAMLVAPSLDVSDSALFITPMGVSAGASTALTCSVGGAASTHCFTTRASTGDNNMTLTVPVLDIIRSKPFNSDSGSTGKSYVAVLSWFIKPKL